MIAIVTHEKPLTIQFLIDFENIHINTKLVYFLQRNDNFFNHILSVYDKIHVMRLHLIGQFYPYICFMLNEIEKLPHFSLKLPFDPQKYNTTFY